jgi:outer membrane lipoprotein SlyB
MRIPKPAASFPMTVRVLTGLEAVILAAALTGCAPTYSPDTYASNAVQLANKVDQGIVVGIRAVLISADPTVGTATLGAAGGIAGSQVGSGATSALGALGGTVAGGLVGSAVSHTEGDTTGYEYIVRKPNGDLLSVTQKDAQPLNIGQHVLIIQGPQARIVADYTVPIEDKPAHPEKPPSEKPSGEKSSAQTVTATQLPPPQPAEAETAKKTATPDTVPTPDQGKPGDDAVDTNQNTPTVTAPPS